MNIRNKNLIQIHVAVFLFGLSGLFGKLLLFSPIIIVLGRVFFSSAFLFVVMVYLKKEIKLKKKKDYFYMVIMGVILAVHWSVFFKSIQVSTVAIGLLIFSTFPIFVTFLEPYFFKEKIRIQDIVIAIITLLGVSLVVPKFQLNDNLTEGVLWGILSSLSYAILSMLNRKYVKEYSSVVIAFYEQFIATLVLIPFLFLIKPIFKPVDILLLILLGIIFTAISHSLFINGLKTIKTQTAGIISSLEPMYGIIFALLIIGEVPTIREVLGGIIILGTAFYSTIKSQHI